MMHNLADRVAAFGAALYMGCALPIVLTLCPSRVSAQGLSVPPIHVTVTDPFGRTVLGLEPENFKITDNNAVLCSITDFASADSPMVLAIVDETPLPKADAFLRPEDELIQTRSFSDALGQVSASSKPRKVIFRTVASGSEVIPNGIEVLQTVPAKLRAAVDQLGRAHQYVLWVEPPTPSSSLKVVLEQLHDLPPLTLVWK
jgi:hypothetical protein